MPVVDTTQSFATGDTVTSTTLNNIMDQSVFVSGAVVSGTGLAITGGGQMTIVDNTLPGGKITNGTITSAKIQDGTIVNADINSSAAIAPSKLGSGALPSGTTIATANITNASVTAPKLSGAQTGSAPIFGARAWVNFDGTGTVAINSSGNVSSITDNGVGDYTINFTTAMPNANYSVVGTTNNATGNGGRPIVVIAKTLTTNSVRITTTGVFDNNTNVDCSGVHVVIFG